MSLSVNKDYFSINHSIFLSNSDALCSLWGTDWTLKYYYFNELWLPRVQNRL